MALLIWPSMESIVPSGVPTSAIRVATVCLKSCMRHFTPEFLRRLFQAVFTSRTGFDGSFGTGAPDGNRYCSGRGSPNPMANQARCDVNTPANWSFIGMVRPVPDDVLALP